MDDEWKDGRIVDNERNDWMEEWIDNGWKNG